MGSTKPKGVALDLFVSKLRWSMSPMICAVPEIDC
jgi:hypothetical protein